MLNINKLIIDRVDYTNIVHFWYVKHDKKNMYIFVQWR